jgi:hypothetical protein
MAATEYGTHACRELAQTEWLGDVVVSADVEPGHAIALAGARGQHDDRHARRGRARPENPAHFESAQHRKIEVEHNQIRCAIGDGFECFVAAADDVHLDVATLFQAVLDQPRNVLLVVHDEHCVRAAAPTRLMPPSLARVDSDMCGTRTPFPWEMTRSR